MDIAAYLQTFENTVSSYTGEDPLDPWDKFVDYLEKTLPANCGDGMSVVFDRLVERFLNVSQYANDIRYVNYCIKCAHYYSNPIELYSHLFSKGVGTRTAALYVAWAQQFEQRAMNEQAEAVYQKAIENQAQPEDAVLHEYRQFQSRTRSQTAGSGARNPLQNSQLTNQMLSHKQPNPQSGSQASVDCLIKQPQTTIIVSRSETSGMIRSNQGSSIQTVSAYNKDVLVCEGSELCFEEVRAEKYFRELQEKRERELRETPVQPLSSLDEDFVSIKSLWEMFHQDQVQQMPLSERNSNSTQQPLGHPRPQNLLSSRRSLGLRLHTEPSFIQEVAGAAAVVAPSEQQHQTRAHLPQAVLTSTEQALDVDTSRLQPLSEQQPTSFELMKQSLHRTACNSADVPCQETQFKAEEDGQTQELNEPHQDVSQLKLPEERLDVSRGGTANLSHITPNNSLSFVQATPSRVLPSPTVNTREALDVIMDMFQAPTFLEGTQNNMSVLHAAEREADAGCPGISAVASLCKSSTSTPFTIFQDDMDTENSRAAPVFEKSKPARALAVIPVSKPIKPNDTPPDVMTDESTMWGAGYNSLNSLAACPNSTTDFAMLAQFVSTPFTHKTPVSSNFYQDQENICDGGDAEEDAFIRRQPKKLSPIIEQSPCDEKLSESVVSQLVPASARHGTIVGEGLALAQHCMTTSSITMVQPPPAVLSFRDQTLCATEISASRTTGPSWEVYTSPEQPLKGACSVPQKPDGSVKPGNKPFEILEDLDGPDSPEKAREPTCDVPMSPECAVKPDWLTFRSPEITVEPDLDAFLSPPPPRNVDVAMSPVQRPQFTMVDEPMMSPDRGMGLNMDVSMNASPSRTAVVGEVQLVPDPWDNDLISDLLSTLTPPLASHPRCITWQCNLPNISPKMTLSMGKASLRVDCILGEGAFATVYQATDPVTSEKVVLKVQKPANPWEFYINTQLDARLQPGVRHLYSSIRSAHIFNNGSVLLGELHNYGTLLNAVNIYKTLSDKVMPQPLVMYFTVCILHMVEQLHSIGVIHADIKPDNFLLGEGFMESKDFGPDSVDHGLVLIDLGQSIDMKLFPEGTAFTARCLTSGFQCTEMLSGKPWSYQTDFFGIAGTIYCMLFGTYMQVTNEDGVWKTNAVFRRNPHSDLWLDVFHTLLNVSDCSSVSLRGLRCKLTSVLEQNYSSKLSTLKSRLVVLLLENRKAARK